MSLAAARQAIDAAHRADPRQAELAYADRCEAWVARLLGPDCDGLALLAARCQHLERWTLPRDSEPEGRAGYLRWRHRVHLRQGRRAEELLLAAGVAPADAARVRACVAKQAPGAPLAQALEDAACLVFLEEQITDFAAAHADYDEARWLTILRKSWAKMSPAARDLALGLEQPPAIAALLAKALAG